MGQMPFKKKKQEKSHMPPKRKSGVDEWKDRVNKFYLLYQN